MRKIIPLLLTTLLFNYISQAQILSGVWEGEFTYGNSANAYTKIDLEFILKADSSYEVYSTTYKGFGNTERCKVYYQKIARDTIYLEEVESINNNNPADSVLYQKFILKILKKGNDYILQGLWESGDGGFGKAIFWKRKTKPNAKSK